MTRRFLALAIGLILMTYTTPAVAQDILIRVSGIQPERGGIISVYVFGKDGYPVDHAKALHHVSRPAKHAAYGISVPVETDEFAVKVHHDENGDGKVTKNWTGLFPAEGLGFSNGQRIGFGPPSFAKSKLNTAGTQNGLDIKIRYP